MEKITDPKVVAFASFLFDVHDPEMEKNIGRRIMLDNAVGRDGTPRFGTSGNYPHVIRCIQRIYDGSKAYRANIIDPERGEMTFGRPVRPSEIATWLPEEAAQ